MAPWRRGRGDPDGRGPRVMEPDSGRSRPRCPDHARVGVTQRVPVARRPSVDADRRRPCRTHGAGLHPRRGHRPVVRDLPRPSPAALTSGHPQPTHVDHRVAPHRRARSNRPGSSPATTTSPTWTGTPDADQLAGMPFCTWSQAYSIASPRMSMMVPSSCWSAISGGEIWMTGSPRSSSRQSRPSS